MQNAVAHASEHERTDVPVPSRTHRDEVITALIAFVEDRRRCRCVDKAGCRAHPLGKLFDGVIDRRLSCCARGGDQVVIDRLAESAEAYPGQVNEGE